MHKKIRITCVNTVKCKTCIFHPGQETVSNERLGEITEYIIKGTQHYCHVTNKICRGARDFQLIVFRRLGIIKAPTDQALYDWNEQMKLKHKIKAP